MAQVFNVKLEGNIFFDKVQYFIGLFIGVLCFLSLIPTVFKDVYAFLLLAIFIQIVISFIRFRVLNIVLELVLLFFILIASLPILVASFKVLSFLVAVLVYVFKIAAVPVAFIDLSSFKNLVYFQRYSSFGNFNQKKSEEKKRSKKKNSKLDSKDIKDAEFEEK